MSLKSLRDVYNPMSPKPEIRPPLQDWKDSDAVILLSEFLKIKSRYGIKLCHHDGEPCLVFNPPLQIKEKNHERWIVAEDVAGLFLEADADLRELISAGKLTLPESPARGMI